MTNASEIQRLDRPRGGVWGRWGHEITRNCRILPRNTPTRGRADRTHGCTCQVCLTSKCFPAWSEARGLKSARLSRIGYRSWLEALAAGPRPAIREPGSLRLRYRARLARREREERNRTDFFLSLPRRIVPRVWPSGRSSSVALSISQQPLVSCLCPTLDEKTKRKGREFRGGVSVTPGG